MNLNFQKNKDDVKLKETYAMSASKNWWFWRPIVYGVLSYTEACWASPLTIQEANEALDIKIKQENKSAGVK